MRIFTIGDIHGCLEELKNLLKKVDAQIAPGDVIVFVGDYIDRGPDSKGVVDLLIERSKTHPNEHYFLMGNHEDLLMEGNYWLINGGDETIKSYGFDPFEHQIAYRFIERVPEDHQEFYKNLLHVYKQDKVVVVHAAISPMVPLHDQSINTMIWDRSYDHYDGEYLDGVTVVRGHTPVNNVRSLSNQVLIDTGCVFGNMLTCLIIDSNNPADRSYLSVQSGVDY